MSSSATTPDSMQSLPDTAELLHNAPPKTVYSSDKDIDTGLVNIELNQILTRPQHVLPAENEGHGHKGYMYLAAAMAALGGMLFGYDVGIVSGALLQLRADFSLSCIQRELVVASMLIGAIIASLSGGFIIDYFGRRFTIIVNAAVFLTGALILTFSPSYPVVIFGRLVIGFAVSLSAVGECIYISEIAPARKRGLLVSLNELGITVGFLLAYLIDFLFICIKNGWRYMFGLSMIPAVIQGVGMIFLPKSPRYLVLKKQDQEAYKVLRSLRSAPEVAITTELDAIKQNIDVEKENSFLDLVRSKDNMRGRMFIGCGIVVFQQLTGQPNVLYYAPTIFQSVGFTSDSAATLATVGLGIVKLIATVVALLTVDKAGRRRFLIVGSICMAVSILILGIVTQTVPNSYTANPCDDLNTEETETDLSNRGCISQTPINNNRTANVTFLLSTKRKDFYSNMQEFNISNDTGDSNISDKSSNSTSQPPLITSAAAKWTSLTALMVYVAAYGMGFGPVSWLILSEIFPSSIKGRAIALCTVLNWGSNLLVSLTFLDLANTLGISWTFIMYSIICFVSTGFVFAFVPETRNRSLEVISAEMSDSNPLQRFSDNCSKLFCRKKEQLQVSVLFTNYERMSTPTNSGPV